MRTMPILAALGVAASLSPQAAVHELKTRLEAKVHESKKRGSLPYRLFVPKSKQKLPLVLFLHGAGERGDDNAKQLRHGVASFVSAESQRRRPAIVLAPQCPRSSWWPRQPNLDLLFELLDDVCARYPVDRDRIYLTGLSMGGYGTWEMILRRPEAFAAAIPICGGGDARRASRLSELAIWAFHGGADRVVKPSSSRSMIAAIGKAGGAPRYTEYAGVGHNSWKSTYANERVHDWLFRQRRGAISAPRVTLRKGDRVVFLGDSITEIGAAKDGFLWHIHRAVTRRFPNDSIEMFHAGRSADRVPDLQERLERDVLAKNPTLVVIYIGINDVWHWQRDRGTKKRPYRDGLRSIVARLHAAGADVVLATPTVIGEKPHGSNRFDSMLDEYAQVSRDVARRTGAHLLDLRRRFVSHLARHNPEKRAQGVLTTDGVHMNAAGNRLLADAMLAMLGLTARRAKKRRRV